MLAKDTMAVAGWVASSSQNTWHWLSAEVGDRLATKAKMRLDAGMSPVVDGMLHRCSSGSSPQKDTLFDG